MRYFIAMLLGACLWIPAVAAEPPAWVHPCMMLNATEIQSIRARVEAGDEPWVSALAQVVEQADAALEKGPWRGDRTFNGPQRHSEPHTGDRREMGYSLLNLAMAAHLTGDPKYVQRAELLLEHFFIQFPVPLRDERMEVNWHRTVVNMMEGIDLLLPLIDARIRDGVLAWMREHAAFLKAEGGEEHRYIVRPAGRTGHNRTDWYYLSVMSAGILAHDQELIAKAIHHFQNRPMDPTGLLIGVGGVTRDRETNYHHHGVYAMVRIVEMARHQGVDLYNWDVVDGRSRMERMLDRYAGFLLEPGSFGRAIGHETGPAFDRNPRQMDYFEIAYAWKQKDLYRRVLERAARDTDLRAITLTHSRGSWPWIVYHRDGTPAKASGQ